MWIILHADGGITEHEDWGEELSLEVMQTAVGGLIERIPRHYCPKPIKEAWANEEGLLMGLPINQIASTMLGISLYGDILIDYNKELMEELL